MSKRTEATMSDIVTWSAAETSAPVLMEARKVCPFPENHRRELVGAPANPLPTFQGPFVSGGETGDGGGCWTSLGSSSVAMMSETPSRGRTRPLVWMGTPGTMEGEGSLTFETCTPFAAAVPSEDSNGRTCHPEGASRAHPAGE